MHRIFIIDTSIVHAQTNHCGRPCLLFDNSFWSLNIYFRRFDLNLNPIASDFLVNDGWKNESIFTFNTS